MWMKGDSVWSFGVFNADWFFPLEVMRITWPLSTVDMLSLFEDKSCWTVSLETWRQSVRKLFQKVKSEKAVLKPKTNFCPFLNWQILSAPGMLDTTCWLLTANQRSVLLISTADVLQNQLHEWRRGIRVNIFLGTLPASWTGESEREGNGEKKREQEKGVIFLTPAVRHKDVWACLLRIKAARQRSILSLGLSLASGIVYTIQFSSGYGSVMSRRCSKYLLVYFSRHIFIDFLFYVYIYKERYWDAEHVCVWVSCSLCRHCWFSWSLLNAWQPTDILCHWAQCAIMTQ